MIKIKNQRGITLIALILTIVVALILVSITVKTGTDSIERSKMLSFVAYMQMIQKKVDLLAENGGYSELGAELSASQETKLNTIISESEELGPRENEAILRFFNESTIESQLEIQNIDDEIVIDFTTREVISLKGIKYEGKMYYSQYNLPGGQTIKANTTLPDRTLSLGTITPNINGLNATFTIDGISITNGTLSYSTNYNSENPTWTVITNRTTANEPITTNNITKSGTYYFMLEDNTNDETVPYVSEGISIKLTNSPQLKGNLGELSPTYNYSALDSTTWAYATDNNGTENDTSDDTVYVWIPRFAYETENSANIEFLRGTSYVTTSENYLPSSGWTIPEAFKDVTGVWVRVNSAAQANLDIIDILNNEIL